MLPEQVLNDLVDLSHRHHLGDELFDDLRVALAQVVHQLLGVLSGDDLLGEVLDDLLDVRGDHRRRVDNSIAQELGALPLLLLDPEGWEAEGGIRRSDPLDGLLGVAGVDRQEEVGVDLLLGYREVLDQDLVLPGGQLQVVFDPDRGNDDPQLQGELLPRGLDPRQEGGVVGLVDQGDQGVSHLQTQDVHLQEGLDLLRRDRRLHLLLLFFGFDSSLVLSSRMSR